MTNCKEINAQKQQPERTVFDVRIDIEGAPRAEVIGELTNSSLCMLHDLAAIIEKG